MHSVLQNDKKAIKEGKIINEALNQGINSFLRWESFCHLNRMGYASNDLTDAALNSVTRFKSQLGGELKVHFFIQRPKKNQELNVFNYGKRFSNSVLRKIGKLVSKFQQRGRVH